MKYFILFVFLIGIGVEGWSQANKNYRDKKFINLNVALEEDIKLDFIPPGAQLKGDYKRITDAKLTESTKSIRFSPKAKGNASLAIHDSQNRVVTEIYITVRESSLTKVAKEIRTLLADIEGIEVKIINNRVVVDGQILLPSDMNRIYTVIQQYGTDVASSMVTTNPLAQRKIASIIEREVGEPDVTVKAVNERFILEGEVDDIAKKQRAEIIAKTYVPDVITKAAEADKIIGTRKVETVINLIRVREAPPPDPGKIIQLVIHYVELQKDYTKGFRFQWTPTVSDDTGVKFNLGAREPGSNIISSLTGTVSNLLPKLNWAKEHGHARVLQSTSVIVQDTQPGKIQSLTRIPYQVLGPGNQLSTQFEEAGISANITPQILGQNSDSIKLTIDFSLKALLGLSERGPLVSNNQLQTVIIVRSGESAAVGGLVSNSSGTDYNKLPKDASSNPILSLYASKNFRRNQSQFVVFITPVIKTSASAGSDRIKSKFRLRD